MAFAQPATELEPSSRKIIHVISPAPETRRHNRASAIKKIYNMGCELRHSYLHGETRVHGSVSETLAQELMIAAGLAAQNRGASAIVLDCVLDTALMELKRELSIPVFGPTKTMLSKYGQFDRRYGFILPRPVEREETDFKSKLDQYHLPESKYAIDYISPDNKLNRMSPDDRLRGIEAAAARLIEDEGAGVIYPACTLDSEGIPDLQAKMKRKFPREMVVNPLAETIWAAAEHINPER